MAKKHLRPAAVKAGVLAKDDNSTRFGWHSLRHSLATFFGSQSVPVSAIQQALRHSSSKMTQRYVHSVPAQQTQLQGSFLDALRLGTGNSAGTDGRPN